MVVGGAWGFARFRITLGIPQCTILPPRRYTLMFLSGHPAPHSRRIFVPTIKNCSYLSMKENNAKVTRVSLQWRHNGCDSVSNHQPHHCLLNRLLRGRSKKHQSSASLAFVRGIHRRSVNSPHKWPVAQKKLPFDDVIMLETLIQF